MVKFRKLIVLSVLAMMVFSMTVVVAPKAEAAAQAGDLIKMDGLSSVYYLGADGKRYVFPNEKTFMSWYGDFSSVKTIPQSELEAYPLAANVTVRPGTKLVKITTNPTVYAVEPGGKLRSIVSEENAKNLWGVNWAKRVIDIPDSFFVNYKIESPLTVGVYPVGSLVKKSDSPDVFYWDGSNFRIFDSEAGFVANRFKFDDVVTAPASMAVTAGGTAITAAESSLIDTASGAGGTPGAGTGLTVALSSDSMAATNLPAKSTLVPFLTVNLTASNDGNVTVNDMTFTRFGTGVTGDIAGGYLYAGDMRLTNRRSLNSSDNKMSFNNIGLTVAAGTTKTVTLKIDAADDAAGNHGFRVAAASDIATNGASVSGAFPVSGNIMAYASTAVAGQVTINNSATDAEKKVGETNAIVSEFTLQNDNKEDVNISRIKLKNDGDASNGAVNNFSLELDGVKVAEGISMVDKFVDFKLATPVSLKKGRTITAIVRGDIITDINKSVQLYLNNLADIEAMGTQYGNFYSVKIVNNNLTADDSTGAANITIKGSNINVSFDGPQAADVKDNTTNVVLANFKISSANEDVNIETLPIILTMNATGTAVRLQNVEMVDSANNAAYSSASEPVGSTLTETVNFENVYLKKGVNYTFEIRADIQDNVAAGQTYAASFTTTGLTAKYVASDVNTTATDFSASSLTGKTMTVAAPGVGFTRIATNPLSIVKSSPKVLLYKGQISASSVDNLKVSRMKFNANSVPGLNLANKFDRVYLMKVTSDGTETELNSITSLSTNDLSFSGFTLEVPKGTANAVTYVVRGDVKASPTANATTTLALSSTATDHTVRDGDNNSLLAGQFSIDATAGHVTTIASSGSYTAAFDTTESGTNADKNVLAGTKSLIGRIKFTATNEPARIEKLALHNAGTATMNDVENIYLYKEAGMTTLLGGISLDSNKYAYFEGLNIEVPTTGSTYIYVAADVKGVDYSASPAATATANAGRTLLLNATSTQTFNTKVLGQNTGEELSDSSLAITPSKTATVMGAVISGLSTSFANATLSNGIRDVFSFKVTAPASSNVDYDGSGLGVKLATTTFSIATSSGVTLTNISVSRVNGANGEIPAGTNATIGAGTLTIGFPMIYGNNTDLIVRPGETAEFLITGTVGGVDTSYSLQITIEGVDNNVRYNHNTGINGVKGADTASVAPRIPGLTSVRGGTLSN